jgi:UrcA family protein
LNTTKTAASKLARATWTMVAAVSICMLGNVAQAADSGDSSVQRTVAYRDLDLSDANGVQLLYWRLSSAAKTVCDRADQRDLARVAVANRCIEQAMVQAITAVNSPMLTSLYLAKTGTTQRRFATVAQIG